MPSADSRLPGKHAGGEHQTEEQPQHLYVLEIMHVYSSGQESLVRMGL